MTANNESHAEGTVIVVDDDPANLVVLTKILETAGYQVASAVSGEDGVALVRQSRPDLVLLDIVMPGIGGIEACRLLKSNAQTAEVPVIFLTSKTSPDDVVEGFAAGAVDYVAKPFRRGELLARVETHVRLRRLVEEQRRTSEELTRYADELERSNQDLAHFAAIASHDLQEPLRKVITFSERVETLLGDAVNDQARDYLERMRNATTRMRRFIDDLLEFSRVNAEGRPFEPVDLGRVANEVLEDLESRVQRSGGEVSIDALPVIDADALQMRQLFQNLIGNALKFHRDDVPPVVRVRELARDNGNVTLSVEDNGVGLEEAEAERIFRPFERLHGRSEFEGSGIGLAICARLVARHGGRIRVQGRPGQGSTFVVTLPERQAEEV